MKLSECHTNEAMQLGISATWNGLSFLILMKVLALGNAVIFGDIAIYLNNSFYIFSYRYLLIQAI